MIAQGVKLTIVARSYFSLSPPRDNEKLGLASQTRPDPNPRGAVNIGSGQLQPVMHSVYGQTSLCVLKLPKVGCESTLYISPACFMRGVIQSEEDANWTSLLEIGDKTSRDNTPPLVGLYSYVYLCILLG